MGVTMVMNHNAVCARLNTYSSFTCFVNQARATPTDITDFHVLC